MSPSMTKATTSWSGEYTTDSALARASVRECHEVDRCGATTTMKKMIGAAPTSRNRYDAGSFGDFRTCPRPRNRPANTKMSAKRTLPSARAVVTAAIRTHPGDLRESATAATSKTSTAGASQDHSQSSRS